MNTITCVYCGFNYPEGTPTHGAPVLTEHIKTCSRHPMRVLEQKLNIAIFALKHIAGFKYSAPIPARYTEEALAKI